MTKTVTLREIAKVFLKLGTLGFGGPAAHIAMMREEVVERKKWVPESDFFDLVGAANLIPGPNSTELAIHIGHRLGGLRGLLVAGLSFILPAFFSVLLLSWFYVEYGTFPALFPVLNGIRPVIIAIVLLALWKFRETSVRNLNEGLLCLVAMAAVVAGMNEFLVIFLGGILLCSLKNLLRKMLSISPILVFGTAAQFPISGSSIFLLFLKIGSVLFGSGYVLLAFLKSELVDSRGWLTSAQLLDAVTIGQVTPGPVFTTATFVGYLLKGFEGASLATLGIFLPAFFFVAVSAPFISKLRNSSLFSSFLDGVNTASFALMAIVSWDIGMKSIFNFPTALIALMSLLLLKFTRLNSAWLILAGGTIGFFFFS